MKTIKRIVIIVLDNIILVVTEKTVTLHIIKVQINICFYLIIEAVAKLLCYNLSLNLSFQTACMDLKFKNNNKM